MLRFAAGRSSQGSESKEVSEERFLAALEMTESGVKPPHSKKMPG